MDKTKIAVNIFNKYATEYQNKFMDVGLYGESLDFFCKNIIKQNAEVLELACGPGNITKYLLGARPDLNILGTDLAPNMIELAKINNPSAEFQLMDSRDINKLKKNYDAIMCGFCLPYLNKEETEKLISDAYKLLYPGGLIYISTMEDDYNKSGFRKGSQGDEIFMHYYSANDLKVFLEKSNFKIIDLRRIESPAPDGSITTDLLVIGAK